MEYGRIATEPMQWVKKGSTKNDGVSVIRWTTMLLTPIVVYLSYLTALGVAWPDPFFLSYTVLTYLSFLFGYTVVKRTSDRNFLRKNREVIEALPPPDVEGLIKQREAKGQYWGMTMVLLLLVLVVLAAFQAPFFLNIGEGRFVTVDAATFRAMSATVGVIAGGSLLQVVQKGDARFLHNTVLLILAASSQLVGVVVIYVEAFGGVAADPSYFWEVYFVFLASYASHNMFLASWFPGRRQRGPGHFIGFSLVFLGCVVALPVLYSLKAFDIHIIETIPWRTSAEFSGITLFMMMINYGLRHWVDEFREYKRKKQQQERHLEERHAGDFDSCTTCKNEFNEYKAEKHRQEGHVKEDHSGSHDNCSVCEANEESSEDNERSTGC